MHGTGDDNVHFQNSVQMVEALQEAGKQFEFMAYPNKTHSISGEPAPSVHLYHDDDQLARRESGRRRAAAPST